jgi:hypothetical protein
MAIVDSSLFKKAANSCKEVLSAESTLLLSNLNGCGEAIKTYYPNFVGAITAGATSATVNLIAPNVVNDRFTLLPGTSIKYTIAGNTYSAIVSAAAVISFGGSTIVSFTSAFPVAVPANTAANNVLTKNIEDSVEPKPYNLETGAATTALATSIQLRLQSPNIAGDSMLLRKGAILKILPVVGGSVQIQQDTLVTYGTFTSVPIQPATIAFTANITVNQLVYETFQMLATTELPVAFNDQTEDTTNHASGMQYSTFKTKYDITTQVAYQLRCDDLALRNVVLPNADSNARSYAVLSQGSLTGCGMLLIGEVQITNVQQAAPVSNIVTGSYTLQWQRPTIVITKVSELSAAELAEYLKICDAFMIPARTS